MIPDPLVSTSTRIIHLKDEILARKGAFVQDVNPFARSFALWRVAQPGPGKADLGTL